VVIFVNKPATISMISVTGIELISYCRPMSWNRFPGVRDAARTSSLAKLWICERLRTLMRLGDVASEPPSDREDRYVGCNRGE
jgi:hypothetical protein